MAEAIWPGTYPIWPITYPIWPITYPIWLIYGEALTVTLGMKQIVLRTVILFTGQDTDAQLGMMLFILSEGDLVLLTEDLQPILRG